MKGINWADLTFPPINLWNAPHQEIHMKESKVESPCRNECRQHGGICTGCGRTVQEIAGWRDMTADQRREIMQRVRTHH